MPLDVARLRDSDLASNETPEACWAAVLLWAASWHQVPAASIPNDERWIAKAAGYATRGKIDRAWAEARSGALRGWVECSDGRLYHPVVAEKAREAWAAKVAQRWRSECARIKKHNDRHPGANVPRPTFEEWLSLGCPQGQPLFVPRDNARCPEDNTGDTASKGQGEGQGQGQGHLNKEDSVPKGTGAKRQKTPAEQELADLWSAIKALLVEQETSATTKDAGVLVGAVAAKYGRDVFVDACRATVNAKPANAHTYLVGLCEKAAGHRPGLNRQVAQEQRNAQVADNWVPPELRQQGETADAN